MDDERLPTEPGGDVPAVPQPELGADPSEELAWRLSQQTIVSNFGVFALRCHDLDDLLGEAVRATAEGMRVTLCKYLVHDPTDPSKLLIRAGIGWEDGVVGVATFDADTGSPAGYAFRTRQPVISNHLSSERRFRTPDVLARHGVHRALNVPVRDGDQPAGVLEVDSSHPGRFTHADFGFIQGMANTLAVALSRLETEEALEAAHERFALLARESQHRIKNLFTVVSALISMSEREAAKAGTPETAIALTRERMAALARAADLGLPVERSERDGETLNPVALSRAVLAPYQERICVNGDAGTVPESLSSPMALLLHELATNSLKYGALGSDAGQLTLDWSREGAELHLRWTETGGPAITAPPASEGFGMVLVSRMISGSGGALELAWRPAGLVANVRFALSTG